MNTAAALDALRRHATGQSPHRNDGQCPAPLEGQDVRDPQCEVCQALVVLRPAGPLREEVAPDEQTMSAVEAAAGGVTPPPGWTMQEWVDRYGRLSLLAGVVAAATYERLARTAPPRRPQDDDLDFDGLVQACGSNTEIAHLVACSSWLAARDEENRRLGAHEALNQFGHYANRIWSSTKPYPGDRAHVWRDAIARGETPWKR